MKKNMLLAIVLATFFSCTEVLDEISLSEDGMNIIEDSLNVNDKKDTVIVRDTIVVRDTVVVRDDSTTLEEESDIKLKGLFFTKQEVNIWQERSKYGPYKSTGDFGANSPGEWDRILKNANEFVANPLSDRWDNFYKGSTSLPTGTSSTIQSFEPKGKLDKMRDAAFAFLITNNKRYFEAVRKELLWYASNPHLDFSNRAVYPLNLSDANPTFYYAAGLVKMLLAYDYIKNNIAINEREKIDYFFLNAGEFFNGLLQDYYSKYIPDTHNLMVNLSRVPIIGSTHSNGYACPRTGHNNRRGDYVRLVGLIGVMYSNSSFISTAKVFFKTWLRYAVFADGTMAEHYRGSAGKEHERGLDYSFVTIDQMIAVADALARTGDFELYNYTTSEGAKGTEGGDKSLHSVIKTQLKYFDGSLNRSWGSDKIDGYISQTGKNKINYIWVSQANIYYQDSYISSVIYNNFPASSNISGHGMYVPWGGAFNCIPGKLFMFGNLEGKIWPYPSSKIE